MRHTLSFFEQVGIDMRIHGVITKYNKHKSHWLTAMAQMSNNFTITSSLSAELTGMYQSKQQHTYLEMDPMGTVSLGVRKTFLGNKFSVSLSANDLFDTMRQNVRSITNDLDYALRARRDSRYVALSARWNFNSGNAKAARNRTSGIEDEKRRAQ